MSNKKYTPVPCAIYGRYEVAIMHHEDLLVRWQEPDGVAHLERLQPHDLVTRNHEEFMMAVGMDGEAHEIRLDWIVSADPISH